MSLAQLPPRAANVGVSTVGGNLIVEPVDLVAQDGAPSSGLLYRPAHGTPTVGVHLMHPRTDQTRNYNAAVIANAGYLVLARNSRSVNNDADTLHEDLLLDVAAGVEVLRARGCETVVLLGNSGGGPLAAFYQWQAGLAPEQRIAPADTVARVDLQRSVLPPADGLLLIGSHLGQGATLMKQIDASVVAEDDPLSVDPTLDIYDPRNGFRLPVSATRYDPEFVRAVRRAQVRRIERLDQLARASIAANDDAREHARLLPAGSPARLWAERRSSARNYMAVYRTLADPVAIDPTIEPDDRIPGGFEGYARPDVQNYRQVGFAHLTSPRAWLSTWSGLSSHADLTRSLEHITVPTLIVHYAGDTFTRTHEIERARAGSAADDVELSVVAHTDHYGRSITSDGQLGPRRTDGTDAAITWLRQRF
jgi:pimeloyl-ACP methyl ester carboxylesterase